MVYTQSSTLPPVSVIIDRSQLSQATLERPTYPGGGLVQITGADDSFVKFDQGIGQFRQQDFTVAFWWKTSETLRYFDLAGNRTQGSDGNYLSIRQYGNNGTSQAGIVVVDLHQGDGNNINLYSNAGNLADGKWHQIAVVRNGTSLQLYIDGVLNASGSAKVVIDVNNNNPFKIGRSLVGIQSKFAPNALFYDFRLYDAALTEEQVYSIFKPGLR
jgi:Concanavalin A-like lectin/glucanases superfamily